MSDRDEAVAKAMKGLGEIMDILDSCPWQASCACGWRGGLFQSEADAALDMWTEHPPPCNLPPVQP